MSWTTWTADSGPYIPMENATLQWIVRTQASLATEYLASGQYNYEYRVI